MEEFQSWLESLPTVVQYLSVLVLGVIPFLESYVAVPIGLLMGINLPAALFVAVVGNIVGIVVGIKLGKKILDRREQRERTARQEKILNRVNKFGIPVASLIAPSTMAISITALIMVAAGLDQQRTLFWNIASSILWGGLAAAFLISIVALW